MAKPVVILNSPGVRELLQSPEVESDLIDRARRVAAASGGEYDSDVGPERARAAAYGAEHRRLLAALDLARG